MDIVTDYLKENTINKDFLLKRPVSYSSLKEFNTSPRDYIYYLAAPKKPPSEAQILGQAVECLVFTPDKFPDKFLPYKDFTKRTDAAKAAFADLILQAQTSKKVLIDEEEIQKAKDCAGVVLSNEKIKPYLEGIKTTQRRLEWEDRQLGIPCKGFSDLEGDYNGDFVGEFKTSTDASAEGWLRECYKWEYYLQIGMYRKGYHEKFYRHPRFMFIVVETSEPYKSNLFICGDKYLKKCSDEVEILLQNFKYCMDNQLFHQGYEFWMKTIPYNQMSLPGYNTLRSKGDE